MDPTIGPVTQVFGANPQFSWQLGYGHLGMDWGVSVGTVAVAIAPGTVLWADWGQNMPAGLANESMFIPGSPNSGICVVIQHDGWRSVHAHLNSTHLNPGNRVSRGQEVGRTGNTGNSTGAHLHYEVWTGIPASNVPKFGRYNPLLQIQHEDANGGGATPTPANPAARPANMRKTGSGGATQRQYPWVTSNPVRTIPAGQDEVFTEYGWGDWVTLGGVSTDLWYRDSQGWVWAGAFEEQTGNGLKFHQITFPSTWRKNGGNTALVRSAPTTRANVVREVLKGRLETFTHFVRGERVNLGGVDTDIWFKDSTGYVWAGMFISQSTTGLTEAPAPSAQPNMRRVGPAGATQRSKPNRSGTVVRTIDANTDEVFSHWTKGESVSSGGVTSDLWYKDGIGWVWAGGFTEQTKTGLSEFVYVEGTTPPATGTYSFVKAFAMVTEVRPAATTNFEPGNFPAAKDVANAYIHQFNGDEPADNPTVNKNTVHLDSVIATFQGTGRVASAHFGVEGTRVVQFLALTDRAYAQGPGNGDGWSIETYGAQDAVTMATVAKLIQELQRLKGGALTLKRHKDVMATKCGNGVDLAAYRALVDAPAGGDTPPPPVTPPPVPAKESAESLLGKLRDQINQWFSK